MDIFFSCVSSSSRKMRFFCCYCRVSNVERLYDPKMTTFNEGPGADIKSRDHPGSGFAKNMVLAPTPVIFRKRKKGERMLGEATVKKS